MYFEHNAAVARLVRRQTELVNVARRATASARSRRATRRRRALKLYKAQLGSPKNKRLLKLLQEPGNKQLVQKMELEHIADRKLPAGEAAVPRHRGRPAVRARREGALGAPHRPRRRLHVADGPRRVRAAGHLAARCTASITITDLTAEEKIDARRELEIEYAAKSERLQHRAPAAARARAVREGRQLRRAGRRGADRRRVHRPHDAGPPLVGGTAPGGRGEGRRPA